MVSPACGDCLEALYGIQFAASAQRERPLSVLILADQARFADSLSAAMMRHGISLPVYCDQEERLRREFHVTTTPTYFVLDSTGCVVDMGAGRRSAADFAELMAE
ncbi:MAG: hypothetical protein AB1792_00500 [Candidatus Zixiibacteriota bacterium]